MSCLQYFELYSISSVQCGSNLNKVLRNAATPAAVNNGFKTFMKLHFNPQIPTVSQDIFHSFEKLKAFWKILSNRSIIRIKMRLQNRYGHFLAVHTVQHWHKRFLRIIDWNRLRILFIPEMPCLIQNFHQNYWKFFISQLYRGGLENQTKESAAAGSAVCERPSGGGDDGGPGC